MPQQNERPAGSAAHRPAAGGVLDAAAVRAWCGHTLDALGRAREELDAINVYPVADGDTGTNLYLTAESAAAAVEAVFDGLAPELPSPAEALGAMAHGALLGARGNSGTILAQLLRGMARELSGPEPASGPALARALRRAAAAGYEAVAHPVEGTVLTVATAAADAAAASCEGSGAGCDAVARAAYDGARAALAGTTGQLAALGRAGVVDAGGRGLVAVLAALVTAVTGSRPAPEPPAARPRPAPDGDPGRPCPPDAGTEAETGPGYEVIYLLEAEDAAVDRLRARLDRLGDSLVVVGGDGLWHIHVHVDDAGAAVEAGVEAGRPHRIRISHFGAPAAHATPGRAPERDRAVVAVVPGDGLAGMYGAAGAITVRNRPGEPPASGELVAAIRRALATEVVLLPNDTGLRHTAAAAAEEARTEGIRVALIPTRSAVQGIAALAVHDPRRRFDEDVVAMTSAAGATRYAEVTVAEQRSWTTAGICQAGDVLGLIEGDVAVIGGDPAEVATRVLDRMLSAGGELVTLVLGDQAGAGLADRLERHVSAGHLAVDTVVHQGGHQSELLLIGVE
ncbi:DAK2 domain-containing protein [Streptomyces sp. NPDC058045]|uniref:DAK2 domain-containing protein n=1 Tax=Streptomyces sp. NPDC058045 TaxID=3346311 RepID=UPI0036E2EFCC